VLVLEKPRHTLLVIPAFFYIQMKQRLRTWKQRCISSRPPNPPVIMNACMKKIPHPTVHSFLKRICREPPLWLHSYAADINFEGYHCQIVIMRKSWEAATTTSLSSKNLTMLCLSYILTENSREKTLLFWALASAVAKYPGMICEASPGNNQRRCWLVD